MDTRYLVVGAGIAGASAAFELAHAAGGQHVLLVEREDHPGYHATGRSAALYTETYGGPDSRVVIGALTRASQPFLDRPPAGFSDHPILMARGLVLVARADQRAAAETLFGECRDLCPDLTLIDGREVETMIPVLRPGHIQAAVFEPGAKDIDVDALHQGYLKGFRAAGGTVLTAIEVQRLDRRGGRWHVGTTAGPMTADRVVNAAGAWTDAVAERAGLQPLGLQPLRRTAITFDPPPDVDVARWPMAVDMDMTFYFKPDTGRILASPADETPSPPTDAQPEEWDVAVTVDRLQGATTLTIERIAHKWAGLRSSFADDVPAVGSDPDEPSFIWLAGQGGFGIMTAPAMARLAAALATGADVPADIAEFGLDADTFAPNRLRGCARS